MKDMEYSSYALELPYSIVFPARRSDEKTNGVEEGRDREDNYGQ